MGIFEFVTKGNKKQSGTKTQTAKGQTKPNVFRKLAHVSVDCVKRLYHALHAEIVRRRCVLHR